MAILSAQNTSQLYRHDRVTLRDDPMPLRPDWAPFYHGVASGDPLSDRVIIWTRVTPEEMDGSPVEVDWRVATDPALENIVQRGKVQTGPDRDYTVKVDVPGLEPGTTYYYGFSALERHSLTGRTATTPAGGDISHLRFGVVSCNGFQTGYFNAFRALARRSDLDGIIHLGDYIYENAPEQEGDLAGDRPIAPDKKLITLEDYRLRYASYRLDTNLVRVHQQHPFLLVWDDHEFGDNAYQDGANAHDPATDGDWEDRVAAAKQAYFEWLPIRGNNPETPIYRSVRYGDLMELLLLDTRVEGRDRQVYDPFDPELQDEDRTLLGPQQKSWLLDRLGRSRARWKVIGQQVPFSPLELGWAAAIDQNPATEYGEIQGGTQDAWNGYPAERQQLLKFIEANDLENIVILSGSYHVSLAFDVTDQPVLIEFQELSNGLTPFYTPSDRYDPATGEGSLAVEFVTPSVTSNNFDENFSPQLAFLLEQTINQTVGIPGVLTLGNPNPHLKYPELTSHGYVILDVKPDSVQANWYFHEIRRPVNQERFGQAWYSRNGEKFLVQAIAPSTPKADQHTPAPDNPPESNTTSRIDLSSSGPFVLLGVYPNPFRQSNTLHYSLTEATNLHIELHDAAGRPVRRILNEPMGPGLYTLQIEAGDLPEGVYFYRIRSGEQEQTVRVVVNR